MRKLSFFIVSASIFLCFAAARSDETALLWREGEAFTAASEPSENLTVTRDAASSGRHLYDGALGEKGCTVTWNVTLTQDVPDARIIFRYARFQWKKTMVSARMAVSLTGPVGVDTTVEFTDTGGWGAKPKDWGLAEAHLGDLTRGDYTVTVTSMADDNNLSMDGFFIAPSGLKITDGELSALRNLQITSAGYLGTYTVAIIRQDQNPLLQIGARVFSGSPDGVAASICNPDGTVIALRSAGAETFGGTGFTSFKFVLPELADGTYNAELIAAKPACKVDSTVILADHLLGSLDRRIAALETWIFLHKAHQSALCADLEYIVDYLKTNLAGLNKTVSSGDNLFKAGLALQEGISSTSPVIDNMRCAIDQAEAAVIRVKEGKPYAGVTGELRRSFNTTDQRRYVYRMFVPSAYAAADTVPLILFLHGSAGSEDFFFDMEDGLLRKQLDARGYMAVAPKWHRTNFGADWPHDLMQLVETVKADFPKVDPKRIYVTGFSMGGFGSYSMVTDFPDVFAAACCVSGALRKEIKVVPANVPTQILHGGKDTIVSPENARISAAEIEKAGYPVSLHIFPEWGHKYHMKEELPLTLDWFDKYHK